MAASVPSSPDDSIRFARIMRAAAPRAYQTAMNPPGGTERARKFAAAAAAAKLKDLSRDLRALNIQANTIVDATARARYLAGLQRAEKLAREAGLTRDDSPMQGRLSGAETRRAAVIARRYTGDVDKAFRSIEGVTGRALTQARALDLNNAKLKRILAGGTIDGTPLPTVQRVRKLFQQIARGGFVEVPNRRTGEIIRFKPEAYGNLVYQTMMAEATNLAELDRLVAMEAYYVRIIGSNSVHFCTKFVGRVFYIGPGEDPRGLYPHVRTLPRGGPPFHPHCTKRYVPFNPATASPAQLAAARPTPEVLAMLNKSPTDAQRLYEAEQQKPTAIDDAKRPTPAPEPTQPIAAVAHEVAAAIDRVDRSEITAPEVRRVVDNGLAEVARRGVELPRAVRATQPSKRLLADEPAVVTSTVLDAVFVNQEWPHWNEAGTFAARAHAARHWSTPLATHPLVSTIGSLRHALNVGVDRFRELGGLPILRVATITQRASIVASVSDLAAASPVEFVAEVFAMLVVGMPVPAELLALYERLGGPLVGV